MSWTRSSMEVAGCQAPAGIGSSSGVRRTLPRMSGLSAYATPHSASMVGWVSAGSAVVKAVNSWGMPPYSSWAGDLIISW
jgi:hypothetical protein